MLGGFKKYLIVLDRQWSWCSNGVDNVPRSLMELENLFGKIDITYHVSMMNDEEFGRHTMTCC